MLYQLSVALYRYNNITSEKSFVEQESKQYLVLQALQRRCLVLLCRWRFSRLHPSVCPFFTPLYLVLWSEFKSECDYYHVTKRNQHCLII